MVELLAPAGSFESLRAAVNAGADAVYIGGRMFGARAYAENPDEEQLIRGIEYCHLRGRKLYLTVNTLLKEDELTSMLYEYLLPYYKSGLDGVIVQDFGVLRLIRQHFPEMELHASTQMTVTGVDGARTLQRLGITRVVPARELSLKEIRSIINETGIEVETFIHGAMCYSYSGQCLFSSMLGGRSGNRGRCAQPCRLPYRVSDGPGNGKPAYLLSMKDMCTIDLLPDLIDAGIASMKIEGRMKRAEYTAGVVSIYRKYIDRYREQGRQGYCVSEEDRRILQDLYNRGGFSEGYYKMHNGRTMMAMTRPNHQGTEAARVKSAGKGTAEMTALEPLHKGDVLELGKEQEITVSREIRENTLFHVRTPRAALRPGNVIYRTKNEFLLQELQETYIKKDRKEKIKGDLRIFSGSPAILKLWNESACVTVSGMIAEPAENNPTTEDAIRKQMQKTGNTPFVFECLHISLEDGLFVPVRSLNELRRSGLAELEQAILRRYQREEYSGTGKIHSLEKGRGATSAREMVCSIGDARISGGSPEYKLSLALMSSGQLEAVLSAPDIKIDTIYLDTMLFCRKETPDEYVPEAEDMIRSVTAAGIKCCINCPPVFRDRERKLFGSGGMRKLMALADGFLLHTIDELAYFGAYVREQNPAAELIADDNLYSCNQQAEIFLHEQGIVRTTLSSELNFRELMKLGAREKELIVYGYQPLMQSAQCVMKNTSGCTRIPEAIYLLDRKGVEFPVLNRCHICCNTIYNSVPLQLGGCRKEIQALSPAYVRLSFTIESAKETRRILMQYADLLFAEHPAYGSDLKDTRGHFKRGVE
ncbi:MAG: DUF3656 domain-containing protein [Lachnospiraceae bacterium]|nr:DUF3656 domain-containing protein [Lachnospiraceae bacterium]